MIGEKKKNKKKGTYSSNKSEKKTEKMHSRGEERWMRKNDNRIKGKVPSNL
jgi:hypothetical protein